MILLAIIKLAQTIIIFLFYVKKNCFIYQDLAQCLTQTELHLTQSAHEYKLFTKRENIDLYPKKIIH